jgi:excisionase family DNA binding protein
MTANEAIADKIVTDAELKEQIAILIRVAAKPEIRSGAFYTYKETAAALDVAYTTIYRAVQVGHLKADFVGSEPRLRGRAIFQWLREGGKTGRSRRNLIEDGERAARKNGRA